MIWHQTDHIILIKKRLICGSQKKKKKRELAIHLGLVKANLNNLTCCDSWGRMESDTTERLNWTELNDYMGMTLGSRLNSQDRKTEAFLVLLTKYVWSGTKFSASERLEHGWKTRSSAWVLLFTILTLMCPCLILPAVNNLVSLKQSTTKGKEEIAFKKYPQYKFNSPQIQTLFLLYFRTTEN